MAHGGIVFDRQTAHQIQSCFTEGRRDNDVVRVTAGSASVGRRTSLTLHRGGSRVPGLPE